MIKQHFVDELFLIFALPIWFSEFGMLLAFRRLTLRIRGSALLDPLV